MVCGEQDKIVNSITHTHSEQTQMTHLDVIRRITPTGLLGRFTKARLTTRRSRTIAWSLLMDWEKSLILLVRQGKFKEDKETPQENTQSAASNITSIARDAPTYLK